MNNWTHTRIEDAYEFTSKPRALQVNGKAEIPFIRMEDIPLSGIYADKYLLKKPQDISSATYFENGDLLLAKITPSFENGKQGIAQIIDDFGYGTTEIIPIKAKKDISDILYLFFYLKEKTIRNELAGKMEGSTGRQRLSKELIKNLAISLPPLSTQRKIVYILQTLQKAIEQQDKIIETTTNLKKSLMQKLYTEGLKQEPQKETEIGLVPLSWQITELGKIIKELNAGVSVRSTDRPIKEGELGVLKTSCISTGTFIESENKVVEGNEISRLNTHLDSDTILISRMNTPTLVGANAYVEEGNERLFLPDRIWQVVLADKSRYSVPWLAYQLNILWKNGVFSRIATGTSASMKNITKNRFLSIKIAIPNIQEQNDIAEILKTLDRKIIVSMKFKENYSILFKTLLHDLITGQLDVEGINFKYES